MYLLHMFYIVKEIGNLHKEINIYNMCYYHYNIVKDKMLYNHMLHLLIESINNL